ARHGVHHGARNLGATGTIEVGHRMSRVNPLQGRELCADSRQKFGHWTGAKQVREVESGTLQQANHAHGHHPTLSTRVTEPVSYARRVGAFSATMMVVGGIIGSGIFLNPAIVAQRVGSPTLIMTAWAIGAAVALLGAFVFAELGQRMPAAGGGYVYLREAFGRLPAFLYGWALLLAIATGAMAAVAATFARYAAPLFGLGTEAHVPLGVGAIALLTLVNAVGVKPGATTQNVFTILKLAALAALIVVGMGSFGMYQDASLQLTEGAHAHPSGLAGVVGAMGTALVPVLFSYGGWQQTNFVAEEIVDPERNLPRALVLGVVIVGVTYLLANATYVHTLGVSGLAGSSAPAADVMAVRFGTAGRNLIAAGIAISTF